MSSPVVKSGRTRRNDVLCAVRRDQIVEAAIKLFGRKGFQATRAEEIAAAAGIAKGTLYLYFKSKEAIYTAAVAEACRELNGEIGRRLTEVSGFRERLTALMLVRLEYWQEHQGIYRLLLTLGREARHRRQTNEVLRGAHRGLMAIFAEGVEAGELESADFTPLAWAALDMIRGANERRMDKRSETTPEGDAAWISECVFRQLGPVA